MFIELDYGKILTGKPDQFDGKIPWVSCRFSPTNQSSEMFAFLLLGPNKKTHKKTSEHIYTQWDETHLEDFPASFFDLHQ